MHTELHHMPGDADDAALQALASWRKQGAERLDPVRFHHMETLAQRLPSQPADVRRLLAQKLALAMTHYGERLTLAQQTASEQKVASPRGKQAAKQTNSPLAQLTQYIQTSSHKASDDAPGSNIPARPEMKSLQRFRETWAKIAAEDDVDKAIGRGPENAGPLNSHQLVLRSLTLMRDLSPDYLRRFKSQLDALLWLDQVNQKPTATDAKPARQTKPKK
jgi:hypothetical protein